MNISVNLLYFFGGKNYTIILLQTQYAMMNTQIVIMLTEEGFFSLILSETTFLFYHIPNYVYIKI